MKIRLHSAKKNSFTVGVPFSRGVLQPGERLSAVQGDAPLDLWWEPRAFYQDGSVKWAFVHIRPKEEGELYLCNTAYRPLQADFIYEINAYGRSYRYINTQHLIPLFLRGLARGY